MVKNGVSASAVICHSNDAKAPCLFGSAQYVVIVQYPIEEEKGSVGSSSLHAKHYRLFQTGSLSA